MRRLILACLLLAACTTARYDTVIRNGMMKMEDVIARVEAARAQGLHITADMYTYPAGATGLEAAMPPWVQEGGFDAWRKRLMDPETRARVIGEMREATDAWENLMILAGSPERVLLIGFKNEKLKPLTGKTLAEVAKRRGVSPEDAAIGVAHVFVNGIQVLRDGEHTGARPGRVVVKSR